MAIVLVAVLMASCGDDNGTKPMPDETAPGTILDLTITDSMGTVLSLSWTATGDDGEEGTAHQYDVRYSSVPVTASNWDDASVATGIGAPAAAGETETAIIEDVAWWSRMYVGIKVVDEAGNWSGISNIVAATPYPDPDARFLVQSRDGVMQIDMDWNAEVLIPGNREVEVIDGHIYTGDNDVHEYDRAGVWVRDIDVPVGMGAWYFAALPGDRFLLMSNSSDSVRVVNGSGTVIANGALLPEPGANLQSMESVVVGNTVIISEDGQNHIMQMDLTTYAISQFKDLSAIEGWLGAIDYHNGVYCLCQGERVWEFTESADPVMVAELPEDEYNITGAVIAGGYVFAVANFAGKLYRINTATGDVATLVEGLNYPQDIEFLPAP